MVLANVEAVVKASSAVFLLHWEVNADRRGSKPSHLGF